MIIQHNIMALNAHRQMGQNNGAVSKSLEKLSSGFRINRAGDDAAGLAISEKMRSQINGLQTAERNAQDGISLIQTAEGALNETHSILQRMNELATQSSNGTYDNAVDRANLQKEVASLKQEIDRISKSTNFNGINLLDGSISESSPASAKGITLGTTKATYNTSKTTIAAGAAALNAGASVNYSINWTDENGKEQVKNIGFTFNGTTVTTSSGTTASITTANTPTNVEMGTLIAAELSRDTAFSAQVGVTNTAGALSFTAKKDGSKGAKVSGMSVSTTATTVANAPTLSTLTSTSGADVSTKISLVGKKSISDTSTTQDIIDAIFEVGGKKFVLHDTSSILSADQLMEIGKHVTIIDVAGANMAAADADEVALAISIHTGMKATDHTTANAALGIIAGDITFEPGVILSEAEADNSLTLQVGDTNGEHQLVTIGVNDMSTSGLNVAGIDISTQAGAGTAISQIKEAINMVSSSRAGLGAVQNKLEHTINNLGVTRENITAAESRIRDVDMAKEMMEFTKMNVLTQAAQAMLAQANQQPQSVLQLLR